MLLILYNYYYDYYFSAKNAALRSRNEDWLAQNQDNVPEKGNMFPS